MWRGYIAREVYLMKDHFPVVADCARPKAFHDLKFGTQAFSITSVRFKEKKNQLTPGDKMPISPVFRLSFEGRNIPLLGGTACSLALKPRKRSSLMK